VYEIKYSLLGKKLLLDGKVSFIPPGVLLTFPHGFPPKQCGATLRRIKYKRKFGKMQTREEEGKDDVISH